MLFYDFLILGQWGGCTPTPCCWNPWQRRGGGLLHRTLRRLRRWQGSHQTISLSKDLLSLCMLSSLKVMNKIVPFDFVGQWRWVLLHWKWWSRFVRKQENGWTVMWSETNQNEQVCIVMAIFLLTSVMQCTQIVEE